MSDSSCLGMFLSCCGQFCKVQPFYVSILSSFHDMLVILILMNDLGDCFLFTTAHPLSRRCKQANTCMGTKSILSTGASIVWDSFLFKRNGESDYLQMDKEGQRLQSAYFSIRLTWKKSIQTLHSCANKAPSVMTSVSEESSGGYWGQPSVMYPKPPCWPRSCIMCQESKFW